MNTVEEKSRHKKQRKNLQKLILNTVAIAGVMSVALVAPNVLSAMKKAGIQIGVRQDTSIVRTRKQLIAKGLLHYKNGLLSLTEKGETALARMSLSEYTKQKKKQRWDKRWRVLVFDIPEKRRGLRDTMRRTLRAIGFLRLQDSVWVYPYDCEDLITLLKAEFRVGKDLLYMIVEELEYDKPIRAHFNV